MSPCAHPNLTRQVLKRLWAKGSAFSGVLGGTFLTVALCFVAAGHSAQAQGFWEDTQLVDLRVGDHSGVADELSFGSGLLQDGNRYSFDRWYSSDWVDLRFTFATAVTNQFGIYWGLGTGERGGKYHIEPSLKVGFLYVEPLDRQSQLSFSLSVVLGGYLKEESCQADYGAIGGVQSVNCRMAGSILPPEETLQYLLNEPPTDQLSLSLRYERQF